MAFININGKDFPAPDTGANLVVATNVSEGRNALGALVGQRVGRDFYKLENLQWKFLDAQTWANLLKEFSEFVVVVKLPDMVRNQMHSIRMYPGNRSATPCEWDVNGMPTKYKDCKVNIIDCGEVR